MELTAELLEMVREAGACSEGLRRYQVGTKVWEIAAGDLEWFENALPEQAKGVVRALMAKLGIYNGGDVSLTLFGYGDGYVDCSGSGYGDGYVDGSGYGYGDGSGDGSGSGSGDGSDDGSGYGDGSDGGSGYGDGYGGSGDGDGYGCQNR